MLVNEPDGVAFAGAARASGITALQLHGDETPAYCRSLAGWTLIKALRVGPEPTPESIAEFPVHAFLLDARDELLFGGTGRVCDWEVAARVGRQHPVILAGGLRPENVPVGDSHRSPVRRRCVQRGRVGPRQEGQGPAGGLHGRGSKMRIAQSGPDELGHFGPYGGRFVPETLMSPLRELEQAYVAARRDPAFEAELNELFRTYSGRPTPLTPARRLGAHLGCGRLYLKREDLNHTGAHKINNALGQILLARRMGKSRIIAETGAGQHGVATATACALFGMECEIYMGTEDMRRQSLNVFRMRLLGARVTAVDSGSRTLKDAINEAMRDWVTNVAHTHYLLGSALGAHPYPWMVREFQSVIGREVRAQVLAAEGRSPDVLVACVGGGSNAIGLFYEFVGESGVRMIGVEAGGRGTGLGEHAARFGGGRVGVFQGTKSYVLQDDEGQIAATHSVSAGLDYAAVGPEHSLLHDAGRVEYTSASDQEALQAFQLLSRLEGIIPALESAHAVAEVVRRKAEFGADAVVVINLSGRGDKDVDEVSRLLDLRGSGV